LINLAKIKRTYLIDVLIEVAFPNLVSVINVAGERRSHDVSLLMHNLDDVRANLVGFVLDDCRVRSVVNVQVEKLA